MILNRIKALVTEEFLNDVKNIVNDNDIFPSLVITEIGALDEERHTREITLASEYLPNDPTGFYILHFMRNINYPRFPNEEAGMRSGKPYLTWRIDVR